MVILLYGVNRISKMDRLILLYLFIKVKKKKVRFKTERKKKKKKVHEKTESDETIHFGYMFYSIKKNKIKR